MKQSFLRQIQLFIVYQITRGPNFILFLLNKFLFRPPETNPKNILIYKIGNIGDIVCAVPSFIAIRRFYLGAKITLLTSPGKTEAFGAKELLQGVWYLDETKIYYNNDIDSASKVLAFAKNLRKNKYDVFIQLPDDLANFRTLLRNMIFAKIIGVKSAFGFKIRTIQLFKKTQVDYSFKKSEAENLLGVLEDNGIKNNKVEFDFNISSDKKEKINKILSDNFGKNYEKKLLIALSPAGKREANKWPVERFNELAFYLIKNYNAKIIIIGGKGDLDDAQLIKKGLNSEILVLAGELDLLETIELIRKCSFLVSNDTGTAHMAAAVGLPVVGIYGVRNVFGSWFPYGKNHKILYHKFINCDYREESCIKKSVALITFDEVARACDQFIEKLNKNQYGL